MTKKKGKSKNLELNLTFVFLPVIIVAIVFVVMLVLKDTGIDDEGEKTIITSSTLQKTVNIADLSTAQYSYNGIAQIYEDEAKEKLKCNIYYHARVKAGVDMSQITFEIDDENKTVKPSLPEIEITANLLDNMELEFMPGESDVSLQEARTVCKEDALNESKESSELYKVAEENLKNTIEALIYPLLNDQGYTVVW